MNWEQFAVQSCCLFLSLRTGTKIFGFISLLGSIVGGTFAIYGIAWSSKHGSKLDAIDVVDLVAQAVQMISSFLLVLAAYQDKPKFIPLWLVSTVVNAALETFLLPSLVFRFGYVYVDTFAEWVIWTVFLLVDDVYGLIVVFSYYLSLSSTRAGDNVT